MRMNGHGDVFGQSGHLHCQHAFGDKFSRSRANDANTQHPFSLRIEDEFGHAFGPIDGHGSA